MPSDKWWIPFWTLSLGHTHFIRLYWCAWIWSSKELHPLHGCLWHRVLHIDVGRTGGFCFILKEIQVPDPTTHFGTGRAEGVNRLCDRGIILSVGKQAGLGEWTIKNCQGMNRVIIWMDVPLEIKAAPKTASEASRDRQNTGPDQNKEQRCRDVSMKPVLPQVLPLGPSPDAGMCGMSFRPSWASLGPGVHCWVVGGFLSKIFC